MLGLAGLDVISKDVFESRLLERIAGRFRHRPQ
jgi:hypothetical protein